MGNETFCTHVTGVGELVPEFVAAGMLVLFGDQAPPELREIAVVHGAGQFTGDVAPGMTLYLGGQAFCITAVGDVARKTLRELGHCTIKFNGLTAPEMPGDLCVETGPIPSLQVGDEISVK
jgi:PTS system glucitol/sorbitol-specific IIA component